MEFFSNVSGLFDKDKKMFDIIKNEKEVKEILNGNDLNKKKEIENFIMSFDYENIVEHFPKFKDKLEEIKKKIKINIQHLEEMKENIDKKEKEKNELKQKYNSIVERKCDKIDKSINPKKQELEILEQEEVNLKGKLKELKQKKTLELKKAELKRKLKALKQKKVKLKEELEELKQKKLELRQQCIIIVETNYNKIDKSINETKKKQKRLKLRVNGTVCSAALLKMYGISDFDFIGAGSFNAVFKDKTSQKVYKVCFKDDEKTGLSQDQKKNAEIHDLIDQVTKDSEKKSPTKNWTKYLSDAKPLDGIRIFESDLASMDGGDWIEGAEKNKSTGKTLDSVLHKMKNVIACVAELHKKGISVNDLKYENLLKMQKSKYNVSDEELKKLGFEKRKGIDGKEHWYKRKKGTDGKEYWHKIHKNYWQVSDMGGSTNIKNESKGLERAVHTRDYIINDLNFAKNKRMRDIYALGLMFLGFLCRKKINNVKNFDLVKKLKILIPNEYEKFFNSELKTIYLEIYKKPIFEILKLVKEMISQNSKDDYSYFYALDKIKAIEIFVKDCENKYNKKI